MATNPDEKEQKGAKASADRNAQVDDFDRVGTEISIMLRHAQESASKIRGDAEVEAQALVEQVRADLEADRIAHDQAAAELIARTEETANALRVEAEKVAREAQENADQHAATRKQEVDAELAQVVSDTNADRQRASEELEAAATQAEQIIAQAEADAKIRAKEIIAQGHADAQVTSDAVIAQAREALQQLVDIETRSRGELDQTRKSIDAVLKQMTITRLGEKSLAAAARAKKS